MWMESGQVDNRAAGGLANTAVSALDAIDDGYRAGFRRRGDLEGGDQLAALAGAELGEAVLADEPLREEEAAAREPPASDFALPESAGDPLADESEPAAGSDLCAGDRLALFDPERESVR